MFFEAALDARSSLICVQADVETPVTAVSVEVWALLRLVAQAGPQK